MRSRSFLRQKSPDYFLVSVSNRGNLKLCTQYAMAGFTNSINGLWTFLDMDIGDYVSFLYGARVWNLYRIVDKVAYKNAETLPLWQPVTFKMSGKTYYFPFRLYLEQERELEEPMIRQEFAYVAETLLLRGGYRKTHFQADHVTLNNVSSMGYHSRGRTEKIDLGAEPFTPRIVFKKENQENPEKFYFHEFVLQSLVRKTLQGSEVFRNILDFFGLENSPTEFEVLGEKALPEGYADLFIKLRHPVGSNRYIIVEVKTGRASRRDAEQLEMYMRELGSEVAGGVLIAKGFPKTVYGRQDIVPVRYLFKNLDPDGAYSFDELASMLELEAIK